MTIMLKKFKYTFMACAASAMLLQACSSKDVIELEPQFSLDAVNNPSSISQVEQVLLGAYSNFRNGNYYGSNSGTGSGWALMPDVLSDNLYETIESLANSRTMVEWNYNPGTGQVASMYQAPYLVISSANIVLRDVDKFSQNVQQVNRIKGQAYAIRALAHFDLFRYFANSYDRNSTTDLAVPYTKEFVVSTAAKPARLNNKEFYDALFADLTQAVTLLADVDKPVNDAGALSRPYIDLTAAYAIQARAYLYASQWPEAIAAATAAINRRPLVNLNQAAFTGMYNQTNSGEIIWNVQFEANQSGPTYLTYFPAQQRAYFRPALEVATISGTSGLLRSEDIRYNAFFSNVGGELALTKYRGKGSNTDGAANFIAFRTGEMYLIRAEARAKSGQGALALEDLNTLRAARIPSYVPVAGLSGDALLTAIADERRRELIGEGHRFFDLKRTTRVITRGSTCGNTNLSPVGVCTLPSTAREWTLPIPEGVINANESQVQNPGY